MSRRTPENAYELRNSGHKVQVNSKQAADTMPVVGGFDTLANNHPEKVAAVIGVTAACATGVGCLPAIAVAGAGQVAEDVSNHCSATQTAVDGGLSVVGGGVGAFGEAGIGALDGSGGLQQAVRAHSAVEAGGATAIGAC